MSWVNDELKQLEGTKRLDYIISRKKVRMESSENPKRYVNLYLPINEDELNDIMGDMLGRELEGMVLDNSFVNWYYTHKNFPIESLFDENQLVMEYHNLKEPEYMYGENINVFKENGEMYLGTIWSAPRYKVRKGTL